MNLCLKIDNNIKQLTIFEIYLSTIDTFLNSTSSSSWEEQILN